MNGEGRLRPSWARVCGVGTSGGARERGRQNSLRPPRRTVLACASLYYHPPVTLTHLFVCLSVPEVLHAHPAGLRPHQLHTTRWVSQPTFSSFAFDQYLNYYSEMSRTVFRSYCQDFMYKLYDSYLIPKTLLDIQISDEGLKQITHRLNTETFTLFAWQRAHVVFYRRYFESNNSNRFKSLLHLFKFLFLLEFL